MEFTRCDYTDEQKQVLMQVIRFAEIFADQIGHIFRNHGMDKIYGTHLNLVVRPEFRYATKQVSVGLWNGNAGVLTVVKGDGTDDEYIPSGNNTKELEKLFVATERKRREQEIKDIETALHPNGVRSGRTFSDCVVDRREQVSE